MNVNSNALTCGNMKWLCNLFFAFYSLGSLHTLFAQSLPEYVWAAEHPIAALKIKHLTKNYYPNYDTCQSLKKIDNFYNGGTNDAFRHVFFMALYAQRISSKTVRTLGIAHEKGNRRTWKRHRLEDGEHPDSLSSVMDLRNNELGIFIGQTYPKASRYELIEIVLTNIALGKAWVMKRNQEGFYLTCEGELINLHLYEGAWFVPKCLITSNTF
jgi:hypothetical protein